GGDGYSVARTLANLGYEVVCLSPSKRSECSASAAAQRQAWELMGGRTAALEDIAEVLCPDDIAVDALFGTGLSRPLGGIYAEALEALSRVGALTVAIDMPSGVSSDTGQVLGIAPRCALTITMGLPKPGLFIYPGKDLAGERIVAEVGFPRALLCGDELEGQLLTSDAVRPMLRVSLPWAHKGDKGCALVVGGSSWYYGAPLLAAEGALRAGAGLCVWAAPENLVERRPFELRELLVWPLPTASGSLSGGILDMDAWPELSGGLSERRGGVSMRPLPSIDAICVGPGLGCRNTTDKLVMSVLASAKVPVVVDADALRLLYWEKLPGKTVLTPHRGEMAALLRCDVAEINRDLLGAAKKASAHYGSVVVLKGAPTVVCCEDRYWINDVADPVLAQGGTGDVLAGIITGLLARGCAPFEAACAGVYLHSRAGLKAAREIGPQGVLAGEIAAAVPQVYAELCKADVPVGRAQMLKKLQ
ncbi:NAD(P)H-hydrate dehydratase, partial [bacterium]|nr:NAD(P)H-hydrate dehydratase [bacterium]